MSGYRSPWEDDEIAMWRDAVRRFAEEHVAPGERAWNEQGFVDRAAWRQAGELGILGADIPAEFGGIGGSFAHSAVAAEELARVGANSFRVAISIHVIAAHYIVAYGTAAQKAQWLPGLCSGEVVAGVAMSEPGGGSDLQSMRTRAVRSGDDYVVDGSKIFITNGSTADLLLLAAKTDATQRARGISMLLFDTATAGFSVGKRLEKVGLHASDTCELFFDGCRIPAAAALLGSREGAGFAHMMEQLGYERVIAAVGCVASMEYAYALARAYAGDRQAFGRSLLDIQVVKFELAEVKTAALAARTFVDLAVMRMVSGEIDATLASMVKYWCSERLGEAVDRCVQLFGGYGYVTEYPIARLYADARIERIYGGTTEIMKEIIGRDL